MRESTARTPQRDMDPSGFARVLEIFYGGNTEVDAAVIFDKTGETVDYHSYMDPYTARLTAAHMGIIFHLAHHKVEWLEKAKLHTLEVSCDGFYAITIISAMNTICWSWQNPKTPIPLYWTQSWARSRLSEKRSAADLSRISWGGRA